MVFLKQLKSLSSFSFAFISGCISCNKSIKAMIQIVFKMFCWFWTMRWIIAFIPMQYYVAFSVANIVISPIKLFLRVHIFVILMESGVSLFFVIRFINQFIICNCMKCFNEVFQITVISITKWNFSQNKRSYMNDIIKSTDDLEDSYVWFHPIYLRNKSL